MSPRKISKNINFGPKITNCLITQENAMQMEKMLNTFYRALQYLSMSLFPPFADEHIQIEHIYTQDNLYTLVNDIHKQGTSRGLMLGSHILVT